MGTARVTLDIEAAFLLAAFAATWLRRKEPFAVLWLASAVAGFVYVGLRYRASWPMTPTYLATVGFPPVLAAFAWAAWRRAAPDAEMPLARAAIGAGLAALVLGSLCPKDFYLPIIKTTSPFAHLLLTFGMLGRASLFVAGCWGIAGLRGAEGATAAAFRWLVWGFGFWTLSLFAGEVWSYTGWGVPMVWEDASTVTAIATWFYYVGLVHLHLTGTWNPTRRLAAAALGIPLILVLNGGPDLGPFRNPLEGLR
ncbi:Cytochrome c assembly protein [uncultured Alphaproteobacteria bacterium]|uniref:Cytochrome c assembly protein n=1 Tax=uncultured Alphaproteobacteria bacterium TaxID=91750 RepID=A0A212ITS5_9PROT|nr:Cytochrome c assembly protein [uncultured Alphaproteobacteria bacterium]